MLSLCMRGKTQQVTGSILAHPLSFGEVPALFDIMSRLPATADYQAMEHFVARLLKKRETTTPKNNWDLCSFLVRTK